MHVKCDTIQNLNWEAASTTAQHLIYWKNEANAAANTTGLDNSTDWNTQKTHFDEFKVTYVKWRIDIIRDNSTTARWGNLDMASASVSSPPLTLPLTDVEMREKVDFKSHVMAPDKYITKSLNVQKAFGKSVNDYKGWTKVGNVNAIVQGMTGIKANAKGLVDAMEMGKIWVTYYVSFRGPK